MTIRCKEVRELLDSFYDNELRGSKFDAVSEHLGLCEDCSKELKGLERTGEVLRTHYEKIAMSEDLSGLWDRVDAATAADIATEPESLREKLARIFSIPRPAWAAVGLIAIAIVITLSYLPGDKISTFAANDCIIDTVESEDHSVMVYEVGDTGMKVIWVMEQQTGEAVNGTGVTT
jgi:hypothetical protein